MAQQTRELAVRRAKAVEERVEAGVVARLHEVAELVCHDELQARRRVCGEARVHADRGRARRTGTPARLHDPHLPA